MTYCVGLRLDEGLVLMSDTRTNGGVDNINIFRKMYTFEKPGDRVITILSAGNLATTQAVISQLEERSKPKTERKPPLLAAPTMYEAARIVGETLHEQIKAVSECDAGESSTFNATLIMGGQIKGGEPTLFMIYPEGNFIEASEDTPYFQIGETKYGRPILVRAFDPAMSFEDAVKMLLLSFDSTIKANLSVNLPLDLIAIKNDDLSITFQKRLTEDNPHYQAISKGWGEAIRRAFHGLPDFEF